MTVVASSGDYGAVAKGCPDAEFAPVKEVGLPASDPLVLSVGGTTLLANPSSGAYLGETAWNIGPSLDFGGGASAGGFSDLFPRPSYQDGIAGIGATRGVPDVAADASAITGMVRAIYDGGGHDAYAAANGTSAGSPLWAALIALADQEAGHHLGFVNADIYAIGHGDLYDKAFHDITEGSNTVTYSATTFTGYQAAKGWDPVTGWGSHDAQVLVPLLAHKSGH